VFGVLKWLQEQDVSFCRQDLENLIVRMTSAWTGLGTVRENTGLRSKYIRVLFLSPLTSIYLLSDSPL
jgi:hypothetical protein